MARRAGAFTLAELLVVLAILAILGLCIVRAMDGATARADVVRCVGNIRNLHIALVTDTADLGHWPQCPYELGESGYDDWWFKELSKYKVPMSTWQCPTIMRQLRPGEDAKLKDVKIHYIPATFDSNPFTPHRWSTMPWLMEIADNHGEGNLIAFPDGAIIGTNRYLANQ